MKGILLFTVPGPHTTPTQGGLHTLAQNVSFPGQPLTPDEVQLVGTNCGTEPHDAARVAAWNRVPAFRNMQPSNNVV